MECKHCGSKWDSMMQMQQCPFCGRSLLQYAEDIISLSDGLTHIVKEYGVDIYKDSKRLISLVMDFVRDCDKEKKLLRIACDNGTLKTCIIIKENADPQRELLIQKAIKQLEDNAFLSRENAEYIVHIVLDGLSVPYKKEEKQQSIVENVTVFNEHVQHDIAEKKPNTVAKSDAYYMDIVHTNKASAQEDREAICELGRKKLVNRDFDEGFKYVQYAGKKGSMNGAILLGYCYDAGLGVRQDKKIAEAYYRQGTISNPEFKSFYRRKYGIGRDLFDAAAKAAERMLKTTYMPPVQSAVVDKKPAVDQIVESKPKTVQQTSTSLFQSIKGKIFGSDKDKENHLWSIVNEKRRPTKDESAAILNLGRKLLKNGNTADGIKLIKFTAQYGYAYGALLLGYCYDNGIGVSKDYNIATAYYDRAGVSGGADESYKFYGWGDRTHRSRAYAVAEKIYNERI